MASSSNNGIPEYLTQEYLENILKHYFTDTKLKVIDMGIIPVTTKGESYCSIMTKIKVIYKVDRYKDLKKIDFIVKSTYDNNPYVYDILRQYNVYNTEMEMYKIVLPQLQQLLNEIGDEDQLCAKTIHVDSENNVIILEDLSVRKFVLNNRFKGMNEDHIKICLRKLAKMHAAAAVLNERQPGILEKYCHGIFNRHVNYYGLFFENVIKVCAKFAESCPELGTYYKEKLLQLIPYIVEYVTRCYDPNPKHFLTLNHGDIWTNNVMFQYDERDNTIVKDVLLIDFQYCSWTSPAVDIYYFFNTSMQDDMLLNQQPKFIQHYHQVLSQTLKKLKYKQHIPSLHELNVQLLEKGFCAVTSLLVNLPLLINDKTEDADFESIVNNDTKAQRFHKVLYTNERVQRIVKVMLPRFDQMGLLDVC